jgi:hypothetical protein
MDTLDYASMGIYFKHFNYKEMYINSGLPAFTLAYRFTGDGKMDVAVAQCSKRDNFNKKTGRQIAADRLIAGDSVTVIPARVAGKLFNFHMFLRTLLSRRVLKYTDKNKIVQAVKVIV